MLAASRDLFLPKRKVWKDAGRTANLSFQLIDVFDPDFLAINRVAEPGKPWRTLNLVQYIALTTWNS
jgi:hypothetical protein